MNINRYNVKPYFGATQNIQAQSVQNTTENPSIMSTNNYANNIGNNINGIYNSVKPNIPVSYTKIGVKTTPTGEELHQFKLSNGQNVVIMKKQGTTIVKTFVKTGSLNEEDSQRGISHFIEHNLFNGSEHYSSGDVFKITNEMGAYTNAATNCSGTNYYISLADCDQEQLDKIINLQADMLQRPTFPADMIEKEKGPVTSEISMITDSSSGNVAQTVIKNLFNIESTSTHLIGGNIDNINKLTRDDVVKYWQKYYTPDNMTTVVVGDVDVDKTIESIAKNFNAKPSAPIRQNATLNPTQTPKRVDVISETENVSTIVAGFSGAAPSNRKDSTALMLLQMILADNDNSRLSKELRKIDSYCSIGADQISPDENQPEATMFYISAPEYYNQLACDTLFVELEKIAQQPPTEEEMTIAKKSLRKSLAVVNEDSESYCTRIGDAMLNGHYDSFLNDDELIESITPQDIMNVAQKYLDLNKVSLGISHIVGTTPNEIQSSYEKSVYANKNNNVSFTGNKTVSTDDVKEYILGDNSRIILNNTNSELSYVDWNLTSYGSVPKNKATAYVLSKLLSNGSLFKDKTQYEKDANLKGIDYSFDANGFSIKMSTNSMKENTLDSINMLKETLLNPRFNEEDFENAKREIEKYCSSLSKSADTILISQLYPQFFASESEIIEGLKSLTLKDVQEHYQDIINNASSNIVVSAPFDKTPNLENDVIAASTINGMKFKDKQIALSKIYSPIQNSRIYAQAQENNQAQILKTYSFQMSGNIEDEVKFELLNTILGGSASSRLFNDLREKRKLAYAVSSEVQSFGDTGIITCQILTTTDDKSQNDIKYDNVQKSLEGFKENTDRLQNELITDEELESAKKLLKQNIITECESPLDETELLAVNANLPYGIKRIDEYFKTIDKITKEDIQIAANHAFSTNPTISIVASKDTLDNQKAYLQSQGQLYM